MGQQTRNYRESEWSLQGHSRASSTGNHRTEQLWYIGLALLFISTIGTFRYRDVSDLWGSSGIDDQILYQLGVWLILGMIAVYFVVRKIANLSLLSSGPLFWFFCYAVCAALSTIYSIGPAYTALRSYQLLVGLILVVSVKDYLRCFFIFVGIWIAINWLCVLIGFFGFDGGISWIRGLDDAFVSYGGTKSEAWRFASAFGHPANISIVTAMAVIWLAAIITRQDWRWKGTMLMWLAITNVLTVGRIGLANMFIGLGIVALGRRAFFPLACALCIISSLVLTSDGIQKKLVEYLKRGQTTEELKQFNGRDDIYERAFKLIDKAPIYGYGFRSGRMQIYNESSSTVHAHNAFLESYMGIGAFGLFLVVATLLSALWRAFRLLINQNSRSFGWQYLALLVPVFTYSMAETGFAASFGTPSICFIAIFAYHETIWKTFHRSADHPFSMPR